MFDKQSKQIHRNRISFLLYLLISIMTLVGCSMSPGARLIKKGEMEVRAELSAYIGSESSGIPAIPNLSFNSKFGITDRFNIGLTCNPFFLIANKTLYLAPSAVGNIVKQNRWIPDINIYSEISLFTNLDKLDVSVFPMFGTALRYEFKKVSPYVCAELALDSKTFGNGLDLHWNTRVGMGHTFRERWFLNLEAGINNIGKRSFVTNNEVGYPVIFIGLSYLIKKEGNGL